MSQTVVTECLCVVGMVLGARVTSWGASMGTATTYQGRLGAMVMSVSERAIQRNLSKYKETKITLPRSELETMTPEQAPLLD